MCREEGQSLSRLAADNPRLFEGFGIFGIVKEVAVDDEGLLEFYNDYFHYPLYMDDSQQFYEALGSRKITSLPTWNPIKLWKGFRSMQSRLEGKNLTGNMIGEGIIQGGIIIFDKNGEPYAVYQERTGAAIPEEDILAALKALKNEERKKENVSDQL